MHNEAAATAQEMPPVTGRGDLARATVAGIGLLTTKEK